MKYANSNRIKAYTSKWLSEESIKLPNASDISLA